MNRSPAIVRIRTILIVLALFGAQLVFAGHAYSHGVDPHPASCELCLQGSSGFDVGACGGLHWWLEGDLHRSPLTGHDDHLQLPRFIRTHPARAPPLT